MEDLEDDYIQRSVTFMVWVNLQLKAAVMLHEALTRTKLSASGACTEAR